MQQSFNILSNFPKIKLCYENIIHNKVYNYKYNTDYCLAAPLGDKCFIWFSSFENKNEFYILCLNETGNISKTRKCHGNFDESLKHYRYGTILYGTLFLNCDKYYFTIENIYFYKGNCVSNYKWYDKIIIMNDILSKEVNLEKMKNVNDPFDDILFGLPWMHPTLKGLMEKIKHVTYKIQYVEFRNNERSISFQKILLENIENTNPQSNLSYNKTYSQNNLKNINNNHFTPFRVENAQSNSSIPFISAPKRGILNEKWCKERLFKIKPDIQNDIYYLYCQDDSKPQPHPYIEYDYAYIPDYKTSVYMNGLFRNIKENVNLDALEESDEEEEFENEKEDRFVNLNKEYNMNCVYNSKFKKWAPTKICDDKNKRVVFFSELLGVKK